MAWKKVILRNKQEMFLSLKCFCHKRFCHWKKLMVPRPGSLHASRGLRNALASLGATLFSLPIPLARTRTALIITDSVRRSLTAQNQKPDLEFVDDWRVNVEMPPRHWGRIGWAYKVLRPAAVTACHLSCNFENLWLDSTPLRLGAEVNSSRTP